MEQPQELTPEERFKIKLWADILLLIHVIWILLILGGTVYMFFNRDYIVVHLIIVLSTVAMNIILQGCPLTWMEEKHRKQVDKDFVYTDGSFAATYANKLFGASWSAAQVRRIQISIGTFSVGSAFFLLYF